jgi:molybdopterin-guanine dinucleotide biosynthesis protein A
MLDSIWTVFDKIFVVTSVEPPLELVERINNVGARVIMVKSTSVPEMLKSSLDNVTSPTILVVSGDRPLIKPNILFTIGYGIKNFDCIIPKWANGQFDILLAAYRTDVLKNLLSTGEGCLKFDQIPNLLQNVSFIPIETDLKALDPELHSFIRIRSLEDRDRIVKIIKD